MSTWVQATLPLPPAGTVLLDNRTHVVNTMGNIDSDRKDKFGHMEETDFHLSFGIFDYALANGWLVKDIRLQFLGDSIRLIVRVRSRSEGPQIGFFQGRTVLTCAKKALKAVQTGTGFKMDQWQIDKDLTDSE